MWLWFDFWTLRDEKLQKYRIVLSQHTNYLHKWLVHLNFDTFTAAMFIFFFFSEISKYVHIHRTTFYLLSQAGPPGLAFNGSGPSRLPRWLEIMNVLWPGSMRSEIFLQMKFIIFKAVWPSRLPFYLGSPLHIISSLFSQFCLFQNAIYIKCWS